MVPSKVSKAFGAMRDLGIKDDVVKPVLKKLLRLYDSNWELIEEDNYRTLADAIFEFEESERMKKDDQVWSEPSPKRPCLLSKKDDQVSSTMDKSSSIPVRNYGEITSVSCGPEIMESTQLRSGNRSNESRSYQSYALVNTRNERGKPPVSSHLAPRDRKPVLKKLANAVNSRQPAPTTMIHSAIPTAIEASSSDFGTSTLRSAPQVNKDDCQARHHITKTKDADLDLCKRPGTREASCHVSSSSHSLVPLQHERKPLRKINDITKGSERVKISLVDEVGCERAPKFAYIPHNIVYQDAYLHISLARIGDEDSCANCKGDCLSSSIPCACARVTGGEFAYTQQGLLREEFLNDCISIKKTPKADHFFYCLDCPLERSGNEKVPAQCKGHLMRKFIKECWRKCGCNMKCGNRVVQRGITCNLQVFFTEEGKGWGVRTHEKLPKGAFVCEYVGEILTNIELDERNTQRSEERHTYPVLLDADWGSEEILKDEEALCLDATMYGNVARFINHRCFDANLLDIPVAIETPDHHYYHVAFFTNREVDAMEELTWDYGIDFDDHNHPIKAFQCCCGSTLCRDKTQRGTMSGPRRIR